MTEYYVVAYDITCPKRLQRVHSLIEKVLIRVQYSIYAGPLKPWALRNLVTDLHSIIHVQRDDVRIYALPSHPDMFELGRQLPLPWLNANLLHQ
jgi:CRISPR-associated protein Cas2